MPEIKEKLAKANEFITYLPEVDSLGQKVISLLNADHIFINIVTNRIKGF